LCRFSGAIDTVEGEEHQRELQWEEHESALIFTNLGLALISVD
jgi:hypothetical protein